MTTQEAREKLFNAEAQDERFLSSAEVFSNYGKTNADDQSPSPNITDADFAKYTSPETLLKQEAQQRRAEFEIVSKDVAAERIFTRPDKINTHSDLKEAEKKEVGQFDYTIHLNKNTLIIAIACAVFLVTLLVLFIVNVSKMASSGASFVHLQNINETCENIQQQANGEESSSSLQFSCQLQSF
jgi:hypothetical protein